MLLVSAATAEAAVATTAAVGAAVAGGSGPKKKDEEEEKPPTPQETASEPPPFIPLIDFSPPTEKPQPPKETASSPPSSHPSIDFQPLPNYKSHPSKATTSTPSNSLPAIDVQLPPPTFCFQNLNQIQSQAKTYSDYLIQQALHPLTSFPSLSVMSTPAEKPASPETHHYTSMFQTILKGFSYIGTNVIDNLDLFRSDSALDPFCNAYSDLMKKHNISSTAASTSQAETSFPLLNIAPLKSTYYEYLNLLANYKAPISSFEGQPPCSIYHSLEGLTEKGMQVTFINGMDNRWFDFLGNIKHLGSLTKFQIDGVYNCTHGKILDFAEILALNLTGSSPVTEEMLVKQFTDFAKNNKDDPHAKCLHYCHSQGALHTLNALEKLPKEVREHIIVVSIAGACVIPKKLCFDSYNYVSDKDVVYKLQDTYTNGGTLLANDAQQYEILKQQQINAQEFIVLKAHEGTSGLDHSFQSLTYVERIAYHLQDYGARKGKY